MTHFPWHPRFFLHFPFLVWSETSGEVRIKKRRIIFLIVLLRYCPFVSYAYHSYSLYIIHTAGEASLNILVIESYEKSRVQNMCSTIFSVGFWKWCVTFELIKYWSFSIARVEVRYSRFPGQFRYQSVGLLLSKKNCHCMIITYTVIKPGLTKCKFPKLVFECIQIRSKDSQVKTQIVLWIFILFKVTRWQHVLASITRPSSGHK
jgi:hypothetical protein